MIEKVIPSESVIAQMTTDKYFYGIPLHRQMDKYTRMGVRIPATDWIMAGWEQLMPLWEVHRMIVLNQKYLQVDEIPIKVLNWDHQNRIHQGYKWLYHAPVDRLFLFDYRRGRDPSGPKALLADFKSIIETDGYSVYHALFENNPYIHLTSCMAHARRYSLQSVKEDEKQANYVLDQIQKLFALEEKLRAEK